jgi:hypothetical protein
LHIGWWRCFNNRDDFVMYWSCWPSCLSSILFWGGMWSAGRRLQLIPSEWLLDLHGVISVMCASYVLQLSVGSAMVCGLQSSISVSVFVNGFTVQAGCCWGVPFYA